eukprot:TRINITY_DN5479_c0_g1_i1.p1 TRINITY_DN5479_c0_g1~~TRINITY_DN5479_c0_g1_i1.p1  ORF type:complete len:749 (+),score=156.76 TRINITY_DN5479_c0_g1_i1:83-2248(+)
MNENEIELEKIKQSDNDDDGDMNINEDLKRIDILKNRLKVIQSNNSKKYRYSQTDDTKKKFSLKKEIEDIAIKHKFTSLKEPFNDWILKQMPTFELPNLSDEKRMHFAISHTNDAKGRRFIPFSGSGWKQKIHFIYYHKITTLIFIVLLIIQMLFVFFERPSLRLKTYRFIQAQFYLLGFELGFVVYYLIVSLMKIFVIRKNYFKSAANILTIFIVILMMVDVIISLAGVIIFRFSRIFRPILLILKVKNFRHAARGISVTMYSLRHILGLFGLFIAIFAVFGVFLFRNDYLDVNFAKYQSYNTFGLGILQTIVSVTFENYPDVIYPALKIHDYLIIYFIFQFIVLFVIISLLLAILYELFKEKKLDIAFQGRILERKSLYFAFKTLSKENEYIDNQTFLKLIKNFTQEDEQDIKLIYNEIQKEDRDHMTVHSFFTICDVLFLRFKKKSRGAVVERESISKLRSVFISLFHNRTYNMVMGILDSLNFFFFVGATLLNWNPSWKLYVWMRIINVCAIIFTTELFLKNYAYSVKKYWGNWWNVMIGSVTLIGAVSQLLVVCIPARYKEPARIFNGLSTFMMWRIFKVFPTIKENFSNLITVFPISETLFGVLLSIYYIFATIGMESFAGYNADANNSFDNFQSSFFVLFIVMSGQNWNIIMFNYMTVHAAVAIYFCFAVFIFRLLFTTLFTAIIIDAFIIVKQLRKNKYQKVMKSVIMNNIKK